MWHPDGVHLTGLGLDLFGSFSINGKRNKRKAPRQEALLSYSDFCLLYSAFFRRITYTGKWSLYPPAQTPPAKVRKGNPL